MISKIYCFQRIFRPQRVLVPQPHMKKTKKNYALPGKIFVYATGLLSPLVFLIYSFLLGYILNIKVQSDFLHSLKIFSKLRIFWSEIIKIEIRLI